MPESRVAIELFRALGGLAVVILLALSAGACLTEARCPETPCPSGQVCRAGNCEPGPAGCGGCPSGQVCRGGSCVSIEPQCEEVGASCNPNGPTENGFRCRPEPQQGEGTCAVTCRADEDCPDGQACAVMVGAAGKSCSSESDCGVVERCVYGRCRARVCRETECAGASSGDVACKQRFGGGEALPRGTRCFPLAGRASVCIPSGQRTIGETCRSVETARSEGDYAKTCATGLACRDGTCVDACRSDSDCSGELECVGVKSSERIRPGIGECEAECEPFGEKGCPPGRTCRPVSAGKGRCVSTGSRPAFSACTPGEGQCKRGTVCVAYQRASVSAGVEAVARCHPVCDTSIGKPGENGRISAEAQRSRDATCPQPEPADAAVRVVHLARGVGSADVYVSGRSSPLGRGLAPGQATAADKGLFVRLPRGKYDFSMLPAGAPSTDLPLVAWTRALSAGEAKLFVVYPPAGTDDDPSVRGLSPIPEASSGASGIRLRAAHFASEPAEVDVYAVPPGGSPTGSGAVRLADDLARGSVGSVETLADRNWRLEVHPAGGPSGRPLVAAESSGVSSATAFVLDGEHGGAGVSIVEDRPPRQTGPEPPRLRCVSSPTGRFGFCRQVCEGGAENYGTGVCDGSKMGCRPTYLRARGRWEHLCGPVGDGKVGDPCNPFAEVGECAEGNYCLEYGNTRSGGGVPDRRGLCRSLCRTDGEAGAALSCRSGRSCEEIGFRGRFGVGRCGVPCEPNRRFRDDTCPAGLKSCLPRASLEHGTGEGNLPPRAVREQSFCSVSGDVSPGEGCTAQNCVPRAECLFERSERSDFLQSLLSPYFRARGARPTCRLRCDPFDGDSAEATCKKGETCLFNYPWSAEVGHCAEIAEQRRPGSRCKTPGLSCGEDSICAARGDENRCLRFCDYEGPGPDGEYQQSTCPPRYECRPFTRDIGVCRR